MFGKPKTIYEVHLRQDDRWRIEAAFGEEAAALSCARAQVAGVGAQEVKVVKMRSLAGLSLETIVFQRKAPDAKNRPLTLGGPPDGAPFCTEPGDLYGFESRVVIGRMLRPFLDKMKICPTELLHGWSHVRRLEEQGTLIGSAIHAVARHHSDVKGVAAKERVAALRGIVDRAVLRARDFAAERKRLPPFRPEDLADTSRAIAYAVGEAEHDYVFLSLLCLHLAGGGSPAGKLQMLLDFMAEDVDADRTRLLDGVAADILGSAETVKELLGAQPSLADGLCALGDIVLGRPPGDKDEPVSPLLAKVGGFIVTGRAPCCREVLVARLRSALAGDQPLDRRDAKAEAALIEQVRARLAGADGTLLGGAETGKALDRRLVRHRQALLRAQGMHDIADRL